MKFKTSDLITRIDNLLRHLEGEAIDRSEKLDDEIAGSRDAWLEDYTDGFRQFAYVIKSRLDAGKPVASEDIPQSIKGRGNSELKFYFAPSKSWRADNTRYDNLLKLKSALQASAEEAVSPTAIKQLGFQDVTFLFTPEAAA